MKVQYYTKQVYGNTLIYLVRNEQSDPIVDLLRKKTITNWDMNLLGKLGVEFERVFEPEA